MNAFALGFILVSLLPYLLGWARAGKEWTFNGFVFGVDDGNAYLGKMRLGWEGDWSFHLFYTPEEHDSEFGLYLPHILLGHLTRLLGGGVDQLAVMFQVWRIVAAWWLILVVYRFIALFIPEVAKRQWALIFSTLAGGLGWSLLLLGRSELLGSLPLEFYVPEAFSFLPLYGLPHIAMGRAFLLLGMVFFLRQTWRSSLWAGLCWNLVGLMVTFYLPLIYAILGAWGLLVWQKEKRFPLELAKQGLFVLGLTLPQVFYNVWIFTQNEAFAQWSAQNILPSPHPLHYFLAYGLWLVFILRGRVGPEKNMLLAWVLIAPILVYLPLNVQRRLSEALLIPLVILAIEGLWPYRRAVIVMVLPSTLLIWLSSFVVLWQPICTPSFCLYRPAEERAAMRWLEDYAESDAVVLGSFRTGNYLPILTDLRPFWGLGTETLDAGQKEDWVKAFYRGELSAEDQARLWSEFRVQYVLFGALEKQLAPDFYVSDERLKLIYDSGTYQIFEVNTHVSARNQNLGLLGDFGRSFASAVCAPVDRRKISLLGPACPAILSLA